MKMTQQKAMLQVIEKMRSYCVEETLDRMSQVRGSTTARSLEGLFRFGGQDDKCSRCHFSKVDKYDPCVTCPNDRFERTCEHTQFVKFMIIDIGSSPFSLNGYLEVG